MHLFPLEYIQPLAFHYCHQNVTIKKNNNLKEISFGFSAEQTGFTCAVCANSRWRKNDARRFNLFRTRGRKFPLCLPDVPGTMKSCVLPGASQVCLHTPLGTKHQHPLFPSPPQAISIAHAAYLIMQHVTVVWKTQRSTESSQFPHRSHLFFVAVQHYTNGDQHLMEACGGGDGVVRKTKVQPQSFMFTLYAKHNECFNEFCNISGWKSFYVLMKTVKQHCGHRGKRNKNNGRYTEKWDSPLFSPFFSSLEQFYLLRHGGSRLLLGDHRPSSFGCNKIIVQNFPLKNTEPRSDQPRFSFHVSERQQQRQKTHDSFKLTKPLDRSLIGVNLVKSQLVSLLFSNQPPSTKLSII